MKLFYTHLVFIFLIGSTHAQSKKEQIEHLVSQKDSLAALLIKERDLSNTTFDSLNNVMESHVLQLRKYGNITDSLNVQILAERSASKQVIDSLDLLVQKMVNQLENHLKAIPKLPDYFIGLWASDKDLSCCALMGCLEFTVNNGVMSISGMEWSSRFLEITNNQNYFIIDILGFSEGDCFHMTLVLLYENNMLFFKEYWNNSYEQNLPTKKELQPLYKCK
jgi:hypothetical protein